MAVQDQGIRDIVAYSQRPIVVESAVDSTAIEFLLIVCGTNKPMFAEASRQLQASYFRDDEILLSLTWAAISASWNQYGGVTYESLVYVVQQELGNNPAIVLMAQQNQALFIRNEYGLLYAVANPSVTTGGPNAELARTILRRLIIARGVFSPVRRIINNAGMQSVPVDLFGVLQAATRLHSEANTLSDLPVVEMAPEFGTAINTQLELTPTGTTFMDTALGGQRAGEVYGLLGPTGGGKTTMGVHLAISNASLCWFMAQQNNTRPKISIYVTAEESAVLLRPKVWSGFFRIPRDRVSVPDPFTNMTTQATLLPYEREDQRGQPHVLSERERYELRRPILTACFRVLDISGSVEYPNAGTGYIDEIEAHISRLVESLDNVEVSMVVIDYAGLVVERHMHANGMDEGKRTPLLKYFGSRVRQQIAERFQCPVWVLHQLNGEIGKSAPTRRLKHTDAADSKSFAENMAVCGVLGVADPVTGCRMFNFSKTRNRANENVAPAILKIHPEFALMVDVSSQYVVSDSGAGFLSATEAAAIGAIQTLSRRTNLSAMPPQATMPELEGSGNT